MAVDPAAAANQLATAFFDASDAVDRFRLNVATQLPRDQALNLIAISHTLVTRAQFFTAEAIGATLAAIAPEIAAIDATTRAAATQLRQLNDLTRGLQIATSLLSLCGAVAAGDPATILAALGGLARQV